MLEVHEIVDGEGRDVFVLRGDLTAECAALLQRTLAATRASGGAGPVLDLRGVPDIDERAADVLCSIASWWGSSRRPLRIDHPSPQLRAVLRERGSAIAEL
jgi:anti-anti-sigma regulatory factor